RSSIAVTGVVRDTVHASTRQAAIRHTPTTAASQPSTHTWKAPTRSSSRPTARAGAASQCHGTRALASTSRDSASPATATAGSGRHSSTATRTTSPPTLAPAGSRCSQELPGQCTPTSRRAPSAQERDIPLQGPVRLVVGDHPPLVQDHHPVEPAQQLQVVGDEDELLLERGQPVRHGPQVPQVE